ncbi:cytochrome P450 [Actinocrispum sp. NPDC049592]|uniref:cytochrome P450 n=1 Tax=Actinocrispum sp. NPDC049592 TaxID=3154835 RepID=UPI003448C483
MDESLSLLLEGYGWLPDRRRRSPNGVVRTRLMGQRAIGLCGPDAARFFYDENHIRRHGAIPGPVQSTLFGHGALHTLDGAAHRHRKSPFLSLVTDESIADLTRSVCAAWDDNAWPVDKPVVLFDEAARVLTRGVTRWAGLHTTGEMAKDLVAMVDGFATPGPRHWRARAARRRQEAALARTVTMARSTTVPAGTAVDLLSRFEENGELLSPRLAAVELLNVIRPTVAVCWFVAFAAHALHHWPEHRELLRAGGDAYALAFAHELRRFYPFAPFIAGHAVKDLSWQGEHIPAGALVLLDLYGQNHDSSLWTDPYTFRPGRLLNHEIGAFELVPQGAGDPHTGHRCPGEPFTVGILRALAVRLARLDFRFPKQDWTISLRRVPARPADGAILIPQQPDREGISCTPMEIRSPS